MFKVALAYLPNAVTRQAYITPNLAALHVGDLSLPLLWSLLPRTLRPLAVPTPLSPRTRNMRGRTSRPSRATLQRVGISAPSPTSHT